MLPTLVGMTSLKRFSHPAQDLVVEAQPAEQLGELRFQHFLAHVRPLASTLISCAMVIDVALLLDLADNRTPAVTAGNQTRKGEIMLDAAMLLGVPAIQNALNAFPQIAGDQRLMLPLVHTAIPLELP